MNIQSGQWHVFGILVAVALGGKKVQAGKDQEKAQSEKDSHSKNRDGKLN